MKHPLALALSFALIRASARIVPSTERAQFEQDWRQKFFHRWQFLHHTGLWDWREAAALLGASARVVPDAVQHFGAQESVRSRVNAVIQSPLSVLAALGVLLAIITVVSGGLPSTRDLIFKRVDRDNSKLVYVWSHNMRGGGDRPLPSDAVEAWRTHSNLISGAAPIRAVHRSVETDGHPAQKYLVITTEPGFFDVMATRLAVGTLDRDPHSAAYVVLSYQAWLQLFHAAPNMMGHGIIVDGHGYAIRGLLPSGFEPLSKQPAVYLIEPHYYEPDAYAVLRINPGVTQAVLMSNFLEIARNVTYYFMNGTLRFGFAQSAVWTPVRSFALGALASGVMLLMLFRIKWRALLPSGSHRAVWFRQAAFFTAKVVLGLACVFTACLEWSRSNSAILFGNFDPGSGPFLLWLYIIGSMGVFFWAGFDQKARCRECLQLLAFPVRMGSPGTMFLDWSGVELCCTEGHGVLHVPHLAPSWAEESDHWIALDNSWQEIFGRERGISKKH